MSRLRDTQLFADIAGEVFVRRFPLLVFGIPEDHAAQLGSKSVFVFAGELRHIFHIHTSFFGDGKSQRFRSGIHARHDLMRLDGAFGEHIRLALQVFVLVQLFQRAEKIIGAVVGKGEGIGAGVYEPVFCGEAVIGTVQLRLRLPYRIIRDKAVHLLTDKFLHTVPKLHHALCTFPGCGV